MLKLINDEKLALKKEPAVAPSRSAEEVKLEGTLKSLTMLSKQVVGKLGKDQVPPTPENYKIYFDAQLDTKSDTQKREIGEVLAFETAVEADHAATLEKDIQNAFIYIKSMTESVATAYTKINQMKKITNDKAREMKTNPSRLALVSYEEDLEMISSILDKELAQIKSRYNATAGLIKNFNQNSIYDKKYGIYNKKYLLRTLESLLKSAESFKSHNTILSIKIEPSSMANITLQRDKTIVNMTLTKLLLKRSRRSDIICHYEDDIFIIILKHTNIKEAQIAIERINDMIESANFIVDANSIDVKLNFGTAAINTTKSKEEILIQAIDSL